MNVQLLIKKIKSDEDTLIRPGKIVTKQEIDNDKYLTSAYYLKNDSIRIVTVRHLIADHLGGREYPRIQRGIDISEFAYDFIMQEGRCLIFIQEGLDYSVLMSLKDKRFLTFGDNRSIPFGISNFIQPRENMMGIEDSYQYGRPILIVEGLRDCLDAQTIYPYTIATQTAGLPKMIQEVLSTLTNTLILGFDNDESGQRAIAKSRYLHFDTHIFNYPPHYKDIGTLSELYIKDPYQYTWFRNYIYQNLTLITGGYTL